MNLKTLKRTLCLVLSLVTAGVSVAAETAIVSASDSSDSAILEEQLEMPVVSITSSSGINSKDTYVDATASIYDENGTAFLTDSPISIRLRGNSTLNAEKKSYRMKFTVKQNLLNIGDGAGKSWNLVSSCYDTSLMRHMTGYKIGDMLEGMPYTPNCRNVEVYLNGEYQGVYLLTEAVNANSDRIPIAEDSTQIENQGYIIEMSRYAEENYFDVGLQRFEIKSDLSTDSTVAQQQTAYISDYISRCYEAVEGGDFNEVDALIDIDSFVDIYIASEIVKNVDAGWDSFYMFKDAESAGGKLTFGPMWDFDLALGNFTDVKGFDSWKGFNVYDTANINANSNPWFCYIVKQQWFRELVTARWNEKISQLQTIDEFIIAEAAANAKSYTRNCEKWNTLGNKNFSEPDEIASLTTHTAHAEYLADWIENRIGWLNDYINSSDFTDGILIDEEGNQITEDVNIAEYTTNFMMYASDYDIDDTPSCTVRFAQGSWWNMFQLCMAGVMLEEDTEYIVSFDAVSTSSINLTWKIQQNYGSYSAYESGTMSASSSISHYETSFTSDNFDTNCALIIEGNGSSGSEVTVTNITLKKVVKADEAVRGDVNADGEFTDEDLVMLRNYLIHSGDMTDYKAGDLSADGFIDVFDLAVMRQELTV